ncbi:hypothetical protein [Timonella sp. A28]|uniref:hypothetical protein n=1 Tax=Timonella sp. A28 TaxID=3442640 RepID=UPI003EBA0860
MSNIASVYVTGLSVEEAQSRARAWNDKNKQFLVVDAEEDPGIYAGYDVVIDGYYVAGIDGDQAARDLAKFLGNAATAKDLEQQTTAQ